MASVTLDFPDGAGGPVRQHFAGPLRVIETADPAEVRSALMAVQDAAAQGAWAAGFVAYEAAPAFDAALVTRRHAGPAPLLWFGIFDRPGVARYPSAADFPPLHWQTATLRTEYDAAIHEIRERIAAGDVYQVNHTLRFTAACAAEPRVLHDALVAARHGRYHALIETDAWSVVSASPELFFDLDGRTITTRPMKGTIRRGRWPDEDRAAAAELAASPKDRAENLMIVDLLRNDIGRIARFGSVAVPRLFELETYPTVHQLTSTVTASLRDGVGLCDIFSAMFPCGSVTGAPKVTAMRAIARLEDAPRGPYCGAVGVVRPDGSATFNVAIRTVLIDSRAGTASYGSGGGITWDSRADAEYDEVIAKAALLTETVPPFRLLETMRLDDGVVARLERHLRRLHESAHYWDFAAATGPAARDALHRIATQCAAGSWRLRLTADRDGSIRIERTPLAGTCRDMRAADAAADATADAAADADADATAAADTAGRPADKHGADSTGAARVAVARTAVSSMDRLLFHKTTARAVYDTRRADAPGCFDVLLYNEAGMATEFTTGNLVALLDGALVTPPLAHGLLAGTLRAELLDAGAIAEAPVSLAEARRATRLYHINSVRGFTRVVLG